MLFVLFIEGCFCSLFSGLVNEGGFCGLAGAWSSLSRLPRTAA